MVESPSASGFSAMSRAGAEEMRVKTVNAAASVTCTTTPESTVSQGSSSAVVRRMSVTGPHTASSIEGSPVEGSATAA